MAQASGSRKLTPTLNMKNWISYVCNFSLGDNEFYIALKIF